MSGFEQEKVTLDNGNLCVKLCSPEFMCVEGFTPDPTVPQNVTIKR